MFWWISGFTCPIEGKNKVQLVLKIIYHRDIYREVPLGKYEKWLYCWVLMMRMTTTKKMVEKIILMLMVMIWSYESLQSQYGNMCLALFESLSVKNALNNFVNNVLSRCTCLLTLLKMDVNNAIKHLVRQVLWSITSYTLILGRGGISAQCVIFRPQELKFSGFIW